MFEPGDVVQAIETFGNHVCPWSGLVAPMIYKGTYYRVYCVMEIREIAPHVGLELREHPRWWCNSRYFRKIDKSEEDIFKLAGTKVPIKELEPA